MTKVYDTVRGFDTKEAALAFACKVNKVASNLSESPANVAQHGTEWVVVVSHK